jgi:ParB family chromosome partitioning protein
MTTEVMDRPPEVREADREEQEVLIACSLIEQDFNYRRRYTAAKMASLQADIKARGLIYGVILRVMSSGRYQLLVGNRRFKAFVAEYGIEAKIKAKVRKLTDDEALALMMAENGEREDPSAIEDAEGAARMLGLCKGNRAEAAARLGWDSNKLARRLAIMNAVQQVRDAYLDDKIDLGHVEILAALRKEVQTRVIEVLLQQEKKPTVDQLKAMAEQSLQSLDAAIFDRTECAGCQFNTGNQQALFEASFSGTRCTNKECYGQKTEAELDKRREGLTETYQVVRIVRPGDNSTVIALRAEGKRPVGEAQAAACRTCADFGACVSAVPDSLGKTYTDVCFNQNCNDEKVAAYKKAVDEAAAGSSSGQANDPDQQSASGTASGQAKPAAKGSRAQPQRVASTSSIRNAIKEYREGVWRIVFQRAAMKLPVIPARALLVGLIAHHPSYLDGSAAMSAINQALGTNVPVHGNRTSEQMCALLAFDQTKLATAFQHLAAHVTAAMPIRDIEGYLNALDVKLQDHWKVNETFFEILTKTELDAVCVEVGLADAAGKHYAAAKNGSKKDFVAAMLKVEGFNYVGAIPKMMRWDPKA